MRKSNFIGTKLIKRLIRFTFAEGLDMFFKGEKYTLQRKREKNA